MRAYLDHAIMYTPQIRAVWLRQFFVAHSSALLCYCRIICCRCCSQLQLALLLPLLLVASHSLLGKKHPQGQLLGQVWTWTDSTLTTNNSTYCIARNTTVFYSSATHTHTTYTSETHSKPKSTQFDLSLCITENHSFLERGSIMAAPNYCTGWTLFWRSMLCSRVILY